MPTSKISSFRRWAIAAAMAGALSASARPADAADFYPGAEAYAKSAQAYDKGDKVTAVGHLIEAADKGHPKALWHLARMHAEGDGVRQDSLTALHYFMRLIDAHANDSPEEPIAPFVARALISVAVYHTEGIPQTRVQPNLRKALDLLTHAALYFGDPEAQFEVGRMHHLGRGTATDLLQAARFYALAARKGHKTAQATLGDLLFRTKTLTLSPFEGLAWLDVARSQVTDSTDAWILLLHEHAFAEATPEDRERGYRQAEALRRTLPPSPPPPSLFELIPSH